MSGEAHVEEALARALGTVRRTMHAFGDAYPDDCTLEGRYHRRPAADGVPAGGNHGWTTGFWPGMQWLAWEFTGDDEFRLSGLRHAADFERRLDAGLDLDHHDLGFLYSLASVTPWRLLGDERARHTALRAADRLMGRFLEPAGILQAWGDLSDPSQRGRTIIDSLMNMPLLSWAHEQTGDERFATAVRRHTSALRDHIIRPDDSTFHTFAWDPDTGAPLGGSTAQGASDSSCWARGQAWGIYGFALNARATHDATLLEAAWRCADYFLRHLPRNGIAYWDLDFSEGSDAPRDSSASAIAVCGLLEVASLDADTARAERARRAAHGILDALIEHAAPRTVYDSDALLLHGVYSLPDGAGVDEGNLWGDYFYLEALVRRRRPTWRSYW